MAVSKDPILKRCRSLGLDPNWVGVNKTSKRTVRNSNKKMSDYGLQLREKQRAKFIYGVLETQFKNTFNKAVKRKGNTGATFLIMLESRFDNIVYRLGLASTRREARQLIVHRHFLVNGKKVDIPSIELKAGDVITVKAKSTKSPKFAELRETAPVVPGWLSSDMNKLEGTVLSIPTREEIDVPIDERLIVELYSK